MGPFLLPLPPSNWNLHRQARGRHGKKFPTKAYQDWRINATAMAFDAGVLPNRTGPFPGPAFLLIEILPGRGLIIRKRDGDNFEKAPIDWLVQHGFLTDDNLDCLPDHRLKLRRKEPSPTGYAMIRLTIRPEED